MWYAGGEETEHFVVYLQLYVLFYPTDVPYCEHPALSTIEYESLLRYFDRLSFIH